MYGLPEAVELEVERPSPCSLPRRPTIRPNAHGIQDMARVLQQPGGQRVLGRNLLADPGLQAQDQGSQQPSNYLDSDLCAPVGLGVVLP